MHFHASGVFTSPLIQQTAVDHRIALLTSFAHAAGLRRSLPMLATRLRAVGIRLPFMIDSGAFSAWNRVKHIDLSALIDCCNWAQDSFNDCFDFTFAALDKIAGSRGNWPTVTEAHDAAVESHRNYDVMRERVRGYVLPTFHGVDPDWLATYLHDQAPYMGLSVSQDLGSETRRQWVADNAPYFSDRRLHGFAMTGTDMLRTVAWASVDSASWAKWAGKAGSIAWVRPDGSLQIIAVTSRSSHRSNHVSKMSPYRRDVILSAVAELGFTKRQIEESGEVRAAVNAVMFQRACAAATVASDLLEVA